MWKQRLSCWPDWCRSGEDPGRDERSDVLPGHDHLVLAMMRSKLFLSGRSQALPLPASCRFEGTEVEVERDLQTGVASLRPLRSSPLEWLRR